MNIFRMFILALGLWVHAIYAKSPELTVWIRAGGQALKSEISSYVQQVLKVLPQNVATQILICTNENDTILEELETFTKTHQSVKVIFSNLSSFSSALNALAQHTDAKSTVLTLSVGINIREDQIQKGLQSLNKETKVYGWSVSDQGNDGRCPGKGWYNTSSLINKDVVELIREGLPKWIDNGVLGMIGPHTIGGNEEVYIMVKALLRDPHTKFILNVSDPVKSTLQLATGIKFQEKLDRKVIVSQYYLKKLHQDHHVEMDFEEWQKWVWSALKVI